VAPTTAGAIAHAVFRNLRLEALMGGSIHKFPIPGCLFEDVNVLAGADLLQDLRPQFTVTSSRWALRRRSISVRGGKE
jgi:hypothetical protein